MSEPCGVLIVDKEAGMTSHDVVNRLRRLYSTRRVGHTGTLDPMATGVLVALIGRAAKAAEFLASDDKRYEAVLRLGVVTDSEDTTGNVISSCEQLPCEDEVLACVRSFAGRRTQIPPMYSAIKQNGVKLVDLARRGIEVERQAREIEVFSIDAKRLDEREYAISVHCSKGTYIRTLCTDIGAALGCGGAMSALRRTQSGTFGLADAHTLGELGELDESARHGLLIPVRQLFSGYSEVTLPDFFAALAHSGAPIFQAKIKTSFAEGERVRLCDKNGFFALGEVRMLEEGSAIKPVRQFVL